MSRFLKLRELHVRKSQAIGEYWARLSSAARQIADEFEAYLELPERSYKDLSQKTDVGYVQIGKWDGRDFEASHVLGLEGRDGRLKFGIKLTLDTDLNAYPKKSIVLPIELGTTGGLNDPLEVRLNAGTSKEKILVVQSEFDEVIKAIYQVFEESLNI